jgi:hypothetical protein
MTVWDRDCPENPGLMGVPLSVKEHVWKGVDSIHVVSGWGLSGCCEHGNEHSGSVKCYEFVD